MPKDLRKKAAGTLAAWMDRAGMGCNTFAELLGISSGSVRRWRCGAHQIAPQWLEGIERITLGELTRHDLRPDLFPREAD